MKIAAALSAPILNAILTALVLPSVLLLLLAACSSDSTAQSTDPDAPLRAANSDDTLRSFAPDGFLIGSAAAGGGHHEEQDYPDPFSSDEAYREKLAAEVNSLTPENQLKWEFVHPEQGQYDFEAADAIVDFAEENDQQVRGHTLLWHSQNPEWLEEGDFTPEELREILRDHILTVVGRYAGRIQQWDVANEIFGDNARVREGENIWIRELGTAIIADAFRWAHEADPEAKLFLNDYGVDGIGAKSNAYYELAGQLLADDVPLHGFGIQGHLSTRYGLPRNVQANLQRFADLGLETAVTEIDVRILLGAEGEVSESDLATQADYYRHMLDACLAVEGCTSFTLWGLTDKYSWVPHFFPSEGSATVTGDDWTRKPSYCALQERLAEASDMTGDPAFTSRACLSEASD